jgi:hypothetical protein
MVRSWQTRAACIGIPLADQQVATNGALTLDEARPFIATYCRQCPVREACRSWAMGERSFSGIAGGVLFPDAGAGRRRRMPIAVPLAEETGYLLATERRKHPQVRRRHLVNKVVRVRVAAPWRALCGTVCDANRSAMHEREALAASACLVCAEIKQGAYHVEAMR